MPNKLYDRENWGQHCSIITTVAVASDLFARAGVVMTFSKVTN